MVNVNSEFDKKKGFLLYKLPEYIRVESSRETPVKGFIFGRNGQSSIWQRITILTTDHLNCLNECGEVNLYI